MEEDNLVVLPTTLSRDDWTASTH